MGNDAATEKIKRGYLKEDFLFFNLRDQQQNEFEFHYHDFYKIIIFIEGTVTYIIEGKSYTLKPWDILFVGRNDLHLPIISPTAPYERMILWLNPVFLEEHNRNNCNLLNCFSLAASRKINLMRLAPKQLDSIRHTLFELQAAIGEASFGNEIFKNSIFLQLMVKINRLAISTDVEDNGCDIKYDKKIEAILSFINLNLHLALSIETIAQAFYLNKYYLMHLFKSETGYTLHSYVQKKRLLKASDLLNSDMQIGDICSMCGFGDYSSFVRAFKNEFDLSPREYRNNSTY